MDDKMLVLMEAMMTKDASLAIERSERREQEKTVRDERIPIKTNDHCVPNEVSWAGVSDNMDYNERSKIIDKNNREWTKSQYEKMGITIVDEYDDLFLNVKLPDGWSVNRTDHSMWNNVKDEKGRERISFFYKGAFYDRDAFSNFNRRYTCNTVPFDDYKGDASYQERKSKEWYGKVYDCDKVIFSTEGKIFDESSYFGKDDELTDQCEKYLNDNYPEYKDVHAYWD